MVGSERIQSKKDDKGLFTKQKILEVSVEFRVEVG